MRTKQDTDCARILMALLDGEPRPVGQLAEQLHLSQKQIRTRLDQAQKETAWKGWGSIERKTRVGVWLEANEEQKRAIRSWAQEQLSTEESLPQTSRESELIFRLLSLPRKRGLSSVQLADWLQISQPTLSRLLKEAQSWMDPWNIEILSDRRTGIRLDYEEKDYRNALIAFFLYSVEEERRETMMTRFFAGIDLRAIRHVIARAEHEWHLHFSNQVFDKVLICLALAVQRKNCPLVLRQEDIQVLENYNEYLFARALCSQTQEALGTRIAQEDVFYLTLRILADGFARISHPDSSAALWQSVRTYDENLISFVDEVLEAVSSILEVSLQEDQKLRQSMILHLRAAIFRMRHGQICSNELLPYIKAAYREVYTASWIISMLCEKYFDLQLTDDELGYLVLLIQSAIERKDASRKAVLIADFPRSCGELITQRIMRYVPEIKQIDILSRYETDNPHFREADIILTRSAMDDPRAIVIDNLLSDEGIASLKEKLRHARRHPALLASPFTMNSAPLFSPDLIFLQQPFENKTDLIRFISARLEEKGLASAGLCESALNREKITSTSISDGIAFPHGDPEFVLESRVVLVTLPSPIAWDEQEQADIIFFACFNMSSQRERRQISAFYKELIPAISTPDFLPHLRAETDNIRLYQYLCS